ncbi:MAG: metal-dependent hydrolase [Methylacidiphilales bacterium]|nr:metal-dependent hydrolase [Candidatus Methylacidiphilales bacterium]
MSKLPNGIRVRWLGHATFDITGPDGRKYLIDPYIKGNPKFPRELTHEVFAKGAYAYLLITHPHTDHFEDALPLLKNDPNLKSISQFEIGRWLTSQGVKDDQVTGMNTGGTLKLPGLRVTMVNAVHTSSITENGIQRALGFPIGYVLRFDAGFSLYVAGDTAVTMDMQIVHDLYHPDLVILPIGDFYTMGAEQAAYALKLLQPKFAIGCHWGTYNGMPPGTPDELEKELARYQLSTQVIKLQPGESLT